MKCYSFYRWFSLFQSFPHLNHAKRLNICESIKNYGKWNAYTLDRSIDRHTESSESIHNFICDNHILMTFFSYFPHYTICECEFRVFLLGNHYMSCMILYVHWWIASLFIHFQELYGVGRCRIGVLCKHFCVLIALRLDDSLWQAVPLSFLHQFRSKRRTE